MEALILLFPLIGLVYLIYWVVGLPFYDDSYRPSLRGFITALLAAVGLAWLFGGDDDCDG